MLVLQQLLPDVEDLAVDTDTPISLQRQPIQQEENMTLNHFICHIQIKVQEHCTIVTSNAQGAQCIAIASPKPGCQNTLMLG